LHRSTKKASDAQNKSRMLRLAHDHKSSPQPKPATHYQRQKLYDKSQIAAFKPSRTNQNKNNQYTNANVIMKHPANHEGN
jgi:hypothetical protein